jgi:DNA polymerase II small subunit
MQIEIKQKSELIGFLLDRGILLDQAHVDLINENNVGSVLDFVRKEGNLDEEKISSFLKTQLSEVGSVVPKTLTPKRGDYNVRVVYNYRDFNKKREFKDFVSYFNNRYQSLSKILRRRDLPGLVSINKLYQNHSSDTLSIIGMVYEIKITKNGHYIIEVEDPTGKTKVLLNKNREEIYALAKEIVHDEVIAITGVKGEDIFFANQVFFPDVPTNKELKKAPDEVYAAFISDVQVGTKSFQESDFLKFLRWMKGEVGDAKQKDIGRKTKYLFIVGDIVDGVGIFPGQEEELDILDVYKQYEKAAEYLQLVPDDVQMIIIPGNHDPLRLADPQPMLSRDYAKPIYQLKNTTIVSSPGIVNIHASKNFVGFDVLMYHGFSVIHYADKVERLREAGGIDRTDLVLKYFLQKRHLAPTHTSNLYIPDTRADPMVIEKVPDVLVCGHTHRANALNYKNVSVISCSCWDGVSGYAQKFGANPLPGRVPVLNLQTREVKIIKFCD